MKSVKQIVLDGLKYFREALLSDQYSTSAASTDTKHALSLKGAYDMYTELNSKTKFHIIEHGVIPPVDIGANNHVHYELTLPKTFIINNYFILVSPVSFTDVAYASASCHWGQQGTDARQITASKYFTVYITNLYNGSAQTIGAYWFLINRNAS